MIIFNLVHSVCLIDSRPHNSRRIHTPILAPIRLCQAKTKKFLIFQEAYFFLHLSLGRKSLNLYTANPLLQSDAFYWIFSIIAISIPFSYRKNLYYSVYSKRLAYRNLTIGQVFTYKNINCKQ